MKSHSCFFAILLSVLVSCHNSESGGGQDVETITIQTPVKQDLKNLIKDIKVIRLETSQQSLFNGIAKMDIYDDKFYILDNSRSFIIVFDKNGKFVSKIGQKGRAPYEYLTIMSFFIDKTSGNIIITDNISPKVIIYSQKGDVLQTIKPDIHPMIIAPVGDGRFVNIHRGKYARYKNSPQMYNNHIHRLNDNFEFVSGNIPDIPNKIDYISDLDSHTYRDGSLLFMPAVSDTVYKITADSTFPLIALNYDRYGKKLKQEDLKDFAYKIYGDEQKNTMEEYENNGYMFNLGGCFLCSQSFFYTKLKYKHPLHIYYDREHKKSISIDFEMVSGESPDIRLFDFEPQALEGKTFYTSAAQWQIAQIQESDSSILYPLCKNISEESNPTIISYEINM